MSESNERIGRMSQTRWLSISNVMAIIVFLCSGLLYTVYGIRYVSDLETRIEKNRLEISHVRDLHNQQNRHVVEAIDKLSKQYREQYAHIERKLDRLIEQHMDK